MQHRSRILVVDDDANSRSALRELLGDAGFEVAVAADGKEGLALLGAFEPHVLLIDDRIPAKHGIEIDEASRRMARPPHLVCMSAGPPKKHWSGRCLPKPLDVDHLLGMLSSLVVLI